MPGYTSAPHFQDIYGHAGFSARRHVIASRALARNIGTPEQPRFGKREGQAHAVVAQQVAKLRDTPSKLFERARADDALITTTLPADCRAPRRHFSLSLTGSIFMFLY